jgi:nucleotide-binding universal stress UspA family protein
MNKPSGLFNLEDDLMYRHILVPVAHDTCSQIAARHAFDLSRLLGSRVTLLHVQAETLELEKSEAAPPWLTELSSQARFEPQIRLITSSKTTAQAILEVAQAERVDLIVMGTHGREGVERLQLGSVAQAVAGSSSIPVQIVPLRAKAAHGFVSRWKEALKTP